MIKKRCNWVGNDPLYIAYHDQEWGVPVHDDRILFEFLLLEGAQAGLSWVTILKKREDYRKAYDNFEADKIANYGEKEIEQLINNNGIIKNRRKIMSSIQNARCFLAVQEEYGSFDRYIWQFIGGGPRKNCWQSTKEIPVFTCEAQTMSEDLVRRGFSFVGPTICYSFMQAVGMVNDHIIECFRYNEIQ